MAASKKSPPIDPVVSLEQRFIYRLSEYLANRRNTDPEFSLPGLRGWMLSQTWPDPAASQTLECLAVLCWSAMCRMDADADREDEIRHELGMQFDYLEGRSNNRPASLERVLSPESRADTYANLRQASAPGSSRREALGLPRFNASEKRS
ncbi:MAG: hypothetical protein KC438_04780 [Thermomicrobiales bacterium]|nr:hypothetical protein [Thermomicrobiales bacterium]